MKTAEKEMEITEIGTKNRIDREFGSLIVTRIFEVKRPSGDPHRVQIELSEGITPQRETCDCRGFKFRRTCRHIDAVYDAGLLGGHVD